METVCSDISHILHRTPDNIALVSSGAVGFGRQIITEEIPFNGLVAKQYLASIGQKALMTRYDEYFSKHQIRTGEILVTHADIEDSEIRANSIRNVLKGHFQMRTLPIINENDTASSEEMQALGRGADNDQNALLIARLVGARVLYIITNTDGVYRDKDKPDSRIESIHSNELTPQFIEKITGGKSEHGTGGMRSKLEVARTAAQYGIETHIINGIDSTLRDHYYDRTHC